MKLDNKVFYSHGDKLNYGVLFVNLGTPKSASVRDVRIYLRSGQLPALTRFGTLCHFDLDFFGT